ncbi:MAG: MMPL family transporter [Candidatus Omnitrophica bacterium]|nr:MMPL family transporter [Candidatus Omnitrophota bacterium]
MNLTRFKPKARPLPPPPPSESLAFRLLRRLAFYLYHYPWFFFYPQIILVVLSVFYTVQNLQFDTNRNDLVGADKKYHQAFLKYKAEFPGQDDLVAVVESEDMEKNRQFVERLGARLEAEPNLFTDVFYKGDLKLMGPKALLFLPEDTLQELSTTLRDYHPFIQNFSQATNLNSFFHLVNRQFATARAEDNDSNRNLMKSIPALQRILEQASESLHRPGTPPSPGINALFDGGQEAEQQMYITYDGGRIYIVTARARLESLNQATVERLRQLVKKTQVEVPGVNVGITGETVLEFDEMAQSQRDTTLATVVSIVLVALIFIFGYHESGRPLKATICLVVGLCYTLAFATLAVGHLNILTITFVPMLIGLAIDFGVHLITRYEEELRHGKSKRAALDKAMVYTGKGIFTGCFTTAGAFLAMAWTNFKGIQEMGIICGAGLLICLIPMMTLLPVMLLRGRQNVIDHAYGSHADRRAQIERLWLKRPVMVAIIALVLCGLAGWQARKVYFDYNLLNMQTRGLPAVVYENKLINSASKSVLFGAVVADTLPEAVALEKKITPLSSVGSVESIAGLMTEDQTKKLALIKEIKQDVAPIHFALIDLEPVDIQQLNQTLWVSQGYLGWALASLEGNNNEADLARHLQALRQAVVRLRSDMVQSDVANPSMKLAAFQQALFNDIRETFKAIKNQNDSGPLRVEDLPPAIRNRFVGVHGKFLLQVYPKKNVWERKNQEVFVQQLRQALDPHDTGKPIITGTPVQLYAYTTLLKQSYEQAAVYSLIAIALLVLIHFRNLMSVVLGLLPVGIGALWTVGLMGWADIPFNPANIMMLPLVIGIGVTNGIHILNRFAEEQNPGILARSTGKAVLVSGLTTIAGFGSLMLAKHQGIASLGYVMAIGTAACMVAGLTVLPAIISLMSRLGWTLKNPVAKMHIRHWVGRNRGKDLN